MKLLKQLLTEAREDYIAQQMGPALIAAFLKDNGRKPGVDNPQPIDIVNHLSQAGPEYVQWTARQYAKGFIKWEDIAQVKNDLAKFKQLSKINAVPNKDINSYKTISDLRNILKDKQVAGAEYKGKYEKLYQGLDEAVKKGHGRWIYNDPSDPIKIYVPTDMKGSICIRTAYPDISWCTTYEEDWDEVMEDVAKDVWGNMSYNERQEWEDEWNEFVRFVTREVEDGQYELEVQSNRQNMHDNYIQTYGGEFYVILTPNGPYQFHFESNQFMDENDTKVDFDKLIATYPSIKKILSPIVTKIGHPHFLPPKDLDGIKKALMATLFNIGRVDHNQMSIDDWGELVIKKTEGLSKYDDPIRLKNVYQSLYNTWVSEKYTTEKIAKIIEKAAQLKPNKIVSKQLPYEVIKYIDPIIGRKYIDGYVPPRNLA
jgi:hypothetical protein